MTTGLFATLAGLFDLAKLAFEQRKEHALWSASEWARLMRGTGQAALAGTYGAVGGYAAYMYLAGRWDAARATSWFVRGASLVGWAMLLVEGLYLVWRHFTRRRNAELLGACAISSKAVVLWFPYADQIDEPFHMNKEGWSVMVSPGPGVAAMRQWECIRSFMEVGPEALPKDSTANLFGTVSHAGWPSERRPGSPCGPTSQFDAMVMADAYRYG